MIRFILNDNDIVTNLPAGTLLLDFIRYHQQLTGTKIGCREGDCGACTVLVGEMIVATQNIASLRYRSATSCLMPLGNAHGKHIVTVEGVSYPSNVHGGGELNLVQKMFAEEGASQCGFCTPGFIVSLAGFCLEGNNAIAAIDGNICRCTGYKSIERVAQRLEKILSVKQGQDSIAFAIENRLLPEYFKDVPSRMKAFANANGMFNQPHSGRHVGGGTDLYVQQPEEMVHSNIDFLLDRETLKGITVDGGICTIGAAATVTDMLESSQLNRYFPGLRQHIKLISSTQIRNMATIGGNFVNASPIGDLTIFFLALDATLILVNGEKRREVPLRNFFKGYKKLDMQEDEYIERFRFPLPSSDTRFNFEKVSKRTHLDIATVNTAIALEVRDDVIHSAALSAGGVGPVPLYLQKTSGFLTGKKVSAEIVQECLTIAQEEITPIGDVRGSEKYKRLLLSQLIKAHFIELFPDLLPEKIITIQPS